MSFERLPGHPGSWPEAQQDWLQVLDASGYQPDAERPFQPQTLKQVFTQVMDLGRRAGRLAQVMAFLGHQEARFRQLREQIGIERAAPPEDLSPVAVVVETPSGWFAPGGWVPDIIDRAAGRDVLNTSGGEPREVDLPALSTMSIAHLFVLSGSDAERRSQIEGIRELDGKEASFEVHVVRKPLIWLHPGPKLASAVFEAASRIHDRPDLFSGKA